MGRGQCGADLDVEGAYEIAVDTGRTRVDDQDGACHNAGETGARPAGLFDASGDRDAYGVGEEGETARELLAERMPLPA
ncbi:hypothetical protein AB0I81_00545 [Nonomuraea sp. NPDC050404]|uniref:hypothetical protein n=1 Tax=Nonomuraea sp. NPDC050404 TaxID=3155783 RepID=UPI00340FDE02